MKSKIPLSNKRGFTLIEVVIVSGIIGLMSLFIMQMTKTMDDNMNRMETRMAEQNLLYLTRLALTDKFACSRTLGHYCFDNNPPNGPIFDGNNPVPVSTCSSYTSGTVGENNFRVKQWPGGDFEDRNVDSMNSIDLARSSSEATIYTRGFDVMLKACSGTSCSTSEYAFDNILNMKKIFLANYPVSEGGVPPGGGIGKVRAVFQYERMKDNNKEKKWG